MSHLRLALRVHDPAISTDSTVMDIVMDTCTCRLPLPFPSAAAAVVVRTDGRMDYEGTMTFLGAWLAALTRTNADATGRGIHVIAIAALSYLFTDDDDEERRWRNKVQVFYCCSSSAATFPEIYSYDGPPTGTAIIAAVGGCRCCRTTTKGINRQ